VPDEVADALVLHGSPASIRTQLRDYTDAGVQLPVLAVLPGPEPLDATGWLTQLAELADEEGHPWTSTER
jgi:hypothetical protein